jgi:hypothetical protein
MPGSSRLLSLKVTLGYTPRTSLSPFSHWESLVLRLLVLFGCWFFAAGAQADEDEGTWWAILPYDGTGAEWRSGEGAALKLAPGVSVFFGEDEERAVTLTHGFDVLSHGDPYHHWELGYRSGLNAAYAGVRYQNKNHADQFEAGVTLGSVVASFGLGGIYDGEERKLRSVVFRANFALLAVPVAFLLRDDASRGTPPREPRETGP